MKIIIAKNNNKKLECIYCKNKVDLKQLLQVDLIVKSMDSEKMEFIWDQLPSINLEERKIEKYLHMTDLGFKILNVCMNCYHKAINSYEGDLK